jgi:TPR repeat protein
MLYILTSTKTILNVDVRVQESRSGDSNVEGVLNLKLKQTLTSQSFEEQQAYLTASATAAYVSFNKLNQRHRFRASVNLLACNNQTYNFTQGSSSSGLGYALACFDAWWRINLQKKSSFAHPVFATGEVLTSGHIKAICHIVEKLESTCKYVEKNQDTISSFYLCYPQENDKDIPDALRKRLDILGGVLIPSERLQYTLGQLLGDDYDGDPLGRWQPFKGLKSFDYEDSVRFFGRDKDIERLYSDIKQNSGLLIVSGASGTGKSSLIKAGLIPKLEQEYDELHWAYCTPNSLKEDQGVLQFILEQLFIAWDIKDQNIDDLVSTLNHSIEEGITSLSSLLTPDTKQCLLYLDQYEEVFSQSEENIESIGSELSIIDGLAKALSPLNIVLAIRNEYLGRLLDNQALRSPIISNVASQLTSQEWEAIVHEQALFSGITFEQQAENNEALDTIIIEEAINIPYALPMVSFLLEQIYSKATEEKTNTTVLQHKHYQALGGLTGAIAYRASMVLQESEASEKTTSTFFDYFVGVNPEGLPFARCVELAYIASNKALSNLVKGFIDANLIVSVVGDADSSAVKLAHDSLFTHWGALKKWIEDSKEYLLWRYSIDGQYTRWQQVTTNKKGYLLKDNQLLKEGDAYLKLNLIRDSRLNEYLRASLKQKSKKQLSVLFVFIILPLLLLGLYQWDKHRIKTYYYSAVGEKWSVPFGINELTDEQVSHRTFSYKMEYQGGVLKRLSHVNSVGTLTKDESRENNALWEYQYTKQGRIHFVTLKSETTKKYKTINFQFSDKNQAIVLLNNPPTSVFVQEFNREEKSDISQHLLTYSSDGYLLKREYQNPYGTPSPMDNKHYGVAYAPNENGLDKSSFLLDKNGGEFGDSQSEYRYNLFGQIVKEKTSRNGKVSNTIWSYDKWGNVITKDKSESIGDKKTHFEVDINGNVLKEYVTDLSGSYLNQRVAIKKFTYDKSGRIAEEVFFDVKEQPTYGAEKCEKVSHEYDDNGNVIIRICYDSKENLNLNYEGCAITKLKRNEYGDIESKLCLDQSEKLAVMNYVQAAQIKNTYDAFGYRSSQAYYGVDGMPVVNVNGYAKVVLKYDTRGNVLEERFFGADGELAHSDINSPLIRGNSYDSRGKLIEESLFWGDEKRTKINGVEKAKYKYDNLGRRIEVEFFDKFDKPANWKMSNFQKQITTYSVKGDYISSINHYDVNGKLNNNPSGITTAQNVSPRKIKNTKVFSTPEGAKIFIDNQFSGITPFHKYVPLGKHKLKIVKAGYQALTSTINITKDEVHSSNFSLSIIAKSEVVDVKAIEGKATAGDAESQFQLARHHSSLNEKGADLSVEVDWLKKAVANKHAGAMYALGRLYLKDKSKIHDGIYWLKQSANLGFISAQEYLGLIYLVGRNIDRDNDQALKYHLMAVKQNHLYSQYALGQIYHYGMGQDKDLKKAIKYYLMAANGGYAEASFKLGLIYSDDKGQDEDLKKAIKYFLMAGNGGYAKAFWFLGSIYRDKRFDVFNPDKAFSFYMLGAELGDTNSYENLARAYERGEGVNRDIKKSVFWYMKALQSEDKDEMSGAAYSLGSIYKYNSPEVSNSFDKAVSFFNIVIEEDDEGSYEDAASYELALMYLEGHGVEVNYLKAVELFKTAHSKGMKRATEWLTRNGEL